MNEMAVPFEIELDDAPKFVVGFKKFERVE